jgi:hypothetical protein
MSTYSIKYTSSQIYNFYLEKILNNGVLSFWNVALILLKYMFVFVFQFKTYNKFRNNG